jgi:hypothetical protein
MINKMNVTERAFIIDKQLQKLVHDHEYGHNDTQVDAQSNKDEHAVCISMQAIVDAILNPNASKSQQTRALVNTSLKYFRWYKQVLSSITAMQSYRQAAASSNNETLDFTRQGQGFVVRLVQESNQKKRQQAQAYVVVKIDNSGPQQLTSDLFLHCEWENQIHMVPMKYVNENKFQAVLSASDKSIMAIVNEESHLYLT